MKKHEHKNCRHLLSSLSDYVDGDLADEICDEIQRHLEDCEDCQVVVDTLRKTVYLYRMTEQPPIVPDPVRARLYHSLNLDEFLKQQP